MATSTSFEFTQEGFLALAAKVIELEEKLRAMFPLVGYLHHREFIQHKTAIGPIHRKAIVPVSHR